MTTDERIYRMIFARVYPLYVQKAARKGRTQAEVDQIIIWLTGYDAAGIADHLTRESTFEVFFKEAPRLHPNASKITGVICGYRVEAIEDPLVQKVRWLDKLIDELAKGKRLDSILRA